LELVEQPLHLVGLVPLLRVGRHTLRLGDIVPRRSQEHLPHLLLLFIGLFWRCPGSFIVPRRSQEHLPHPRTNALAGICSEYL